MQSIRVYDNGGKTIDRYTVVCLDEPTRQGMHTCLALDGVGGKQFSQFSECMEGPHLGRRVSWKSLSKVTREHIKFRLPQARHAIKVSK
jgi:hypothetical protein